MDLDVGIRQSEKYDDDSYAIDLQDETIKDCHVSSGTHKAGFIYTCIIENSSIENSFLEKFGIEQSTFTNCKFEAVSCTEVELLTSIFDSCTFKDCSFGTLNLENTTFINCKFSNCSFVNCLFDLCSDLKIKVFSNSQILKCLMNDCNFMGIKLDGRLSERKGYSASLNERLFYATNTHGTKMYHSEVVIEKRGKNKGGRRMSHKRDYLHPGTNRSPNIDKIYDLYSNDCERDCYDETYWMRSNVVKTKKAYIFCSLDI